MKSKVTVLPILFLPPVEYFSRIMKSANVILEIHETYPKQTYRNRCTIYSANGPLNLSIPVHKPDGNHSMMRDVVISVQEDWKLKHWRAIEAAYNSSPYFLYYKDRLYTAFMNEEELLYKFNLNLITLLNDILNIEMKYKLTKDYIKEYTETLDLRSAFNPKRKTQNPNFSEYVQVFSDKYGFLANLSVMDIVFNLGPESNIYLKNLSRSIS